MMKIGADYQKNNDCAFTVWAPVRKRVTLRILAPAEHIVPMERDDRGYWRITLPGVSPGLLYCFGLDDLIIRPDPASNYQPQGVHGPSQVTDHHAFVWQDADWRGVPLAQMIMYELHVGAFTPEGTFAAVIPRLKDLKDLGINTLEIMPVAQFPGERNWGYDGVFPFATQNSYGGPDDLKRLVDACHAEGLTVILDVVYNHLGPEGNYLADFGPYFTDKYKTPWGPAINFDDAFSDEVKNFFIENALYWFRDFHVDALRLDAVHAIFDRSATPFLQELADKTRELSRASRRNFLLIAESDLNDTTLIKPRQFGGFGLHAQWCDDFHHSLHALLTGERQGYYLDFGKTLHLADAFRQGFVYSGDYSLFRKRRHGNSPKSRPGRQFVVAAQNHDQVGNRMLGERLSQLVGFEALKTAAAAVILSPFIPLLFMGEEYGEENPFQYFVHHSDPGLVSAVRKGRKEEFAAFSWQGECPDPQDPDTFLRSKIVWEKRGTGRHAILLAFYQELILLRKTSAALSHLDKNRLQVRAWDDQKVIALRRWDVEENDSSFCLFNFGRQDAGINLAPFFGRRTWSKKLDSTEKKWGGPGTLLPEKLNTAKPVTIKAFSASVHTGSE